MREISTAIGVSEKKQYWCMFCNYRAWFETSGEEFKTCPRCGNGMFVWEKEGEAK